MAATLFSSRARQVQRFRPNLSTDTAARPDARAKAPLALVNFVVERQRTQDISGETFDGFLRGSISPVKNFTR